MNLTIVKLALKYFLIMCIASAAICLVISNPKNVVWVSIVILALFTSYEKSKEKKTVKVEKSE